MMATINFLLDRLEEFLSIFSIVTLGYAVWLVIYKFVSGDEDRFVREIEKMTNDQLPASVRHKKEDTSVLGLFHADFIRDFIIGDEDKYLRFTKALSGEEEFMRSLLKQ
ncbi:MAG: hypothetical protein HYT98_00715 [Candidatus Sungbacteria bacterium]|nr:hypothetical protein [Candidatus Sungbacteria bacterium]